MFFSLSSYAQEMGIWNFDWNIGVPTGETSDFLSEPSFRGLSIEGRGFVTNNIAVGGMAGWQTFYQNYGEVSEEFGTTGIITGNKRRYLNAIPLMATLNYYFKPGVVMPYFGVGLGTYYIESRDNLGIYYVQDDAWHFGIVPEVGIAIPFGVSSAGANVNIKYNMAVKTNNTPGYSWLTIGIGFSYFL